jgi:hypothetical protein
MQRRQPAWRGCALPQPDHLWTLNLVNIMPVVSSRLQTVRLWTSRSAVVRTQSRYRAITREAVNWALEEDECNLNSSGNVSSIDFLIKHC